ncbi:MAG: hypothetical protein ACF8LK_00965 [Phycisphaerales bacterium JB041]
MQLLLRRTETRSTDARIEPAAEPSESLAFERQALVQRIRALNPTASREYLGSFTDRSLSMYLAHLESAGAPRGARWERPCDSPAIIGRESAE